MGIKKETAKDKEANCPEMKKLKQILTDKGIPFVTDDYITLNFEVARIRFEWAGKAWSCIHGFGTYGGWNWLVPDQGFLELCDLTEEAEPIGYLSADAVLEVVGIEKI